MKKRIPLVLASVFVFLLIPGAIVLANSLPPPFQLYLRFFSSSGAVPNLQAVQLAGCTDPACETPEYLIEHGHCDSPGCFTGLPSEQPDWSLDCAGQRCFFESGYNEIGSYSPLIKIVADTGSEALVSQPVENPDCQYCSIAWKVDLGQAEPPVSLDEEFVEPEDNFRGFFVTYAFTILIEVLGALIIFQLIKKQFQVPQKTWLISVLLANLLSYPVSWLTLPSYGQFQTDMFRRTAIMVVVIVAIATLVLLLLRKNEKPLKKGALIGLIAAIPVCVILFFIGMFISSYGNYKVHVSGLPFPVVVTAAEAFAVVFETLVIWLFLRRQVKIHWVLICVVVINAISLVLGLLIF
ncbi:MAG TPA: hypothetical protein PKK59_10470 [Anaerolineaceae bacterium]|nr:hypothetical protein [Anaerolineaceae bacterium]